MVQMNQQNNQNNMGYVGYSQFNPTWFVNIYPSAPDAFKFEKNVELKADMEGKGKKMKETDDELPSYFEVQNDGFIVVNDGNDPKDGAGCLVVCFLFCNYIL